MAPPQINNSTPLKFDLPNKSINESMNYEVSPSPKNRRKDSKFKSTNNVHTSQDSYKNVNNSINNTNSITIVENEEFETSSEESSASLRNDSPKTKKSLKSALTVDETEMLKSILAKKRQE